MVVSEIWLRQLLHAINKIEKYIDWLSSDDFLTDQKTYDACLMVLIHMGEVVASMIRKGFDIPFDHGQKIRWLRNFLAHQYLDVRPSLIAKTIYRDIPILKKDIELVLSSLDQS